MQILALETSTELGTCALLRDGEIIERVCPSGRPHSETLLPLVRELLMEAGLSVAGLDAIAFGAGPGAFTGLRVACGAAQGLAEAAGLPVVPIVSLEAMAFQTGNEQVVSLLDARMGEVYCANWRRQGDIYALSGEIRVESPEAVPLPDSGGWIACGNAPAAYPALAERLNALGVECLNGVLPRAAAVAELAARRFARGEAIDPALAAPLYVRDKVAKTVAERLSEGGRA
jgi:tRNA threonylcarbamoyladenosine biosynthesis protein TsaB